MKKFKDVQRLSKALPVLMTGSALVGSLWFAAPAHARWVLDRYETLPNEHTYVNAGGPGTVIDLALPAAPDNQGRNWATPGPPMLWPVSVPVSQAPSGLFVFANAYTKTIGGEVWAHTEGTIYGVVKWQPYASEVFYPGLLYVDVISSATCESLNAPPITLPSLQVIAENGLGNPMQRIPYQMYGSQHFIYQSGGTQTYSYSVSAPNEIRIPITAKAWSRNIGNDANGVTMKVRNYIKVEFKIKSFVVSP